MLSPILTVLFEASKFAIGPPVVITCVIPAALISKPRLLINTCTSPLADFAGAVPAIESHLELPIFCIAPIYL